MSYNNYLTEPRLNISKELLTSGANVLIKDVAARVGYEDQFYFSRIFRSYEGMSPSEYMEKAAKGKNNEK